MHGKDSILILQNVLINPDEIDKHLFSLVIEKLSLVEDETRSSGELPPRSYFCLNKFRMLIDCKLGWEWQWVDRHCARMQRS